jgi:hypothetical protein
MYRFLGDLFILAPNRGLMYLSNLTNLKNLQTDFFLVQKTKPKYANSATMEVFVPKALKGGFV